MKTSGELTQHQLADMSGIPRGRIGSWITRKTVASTEDLELLAKSFNVEPYYFFMKPGTQGTPKPIERDDDFKAFMDELAEKYLSDIDKAAYFHIGGHKTFLRVLRENYETNDVKVTDWYIELAKQVSLYSSIDLIEKIRNRRLNANPTKKSESA